ncbi:MAG TPA: hypothetical protein VGP72_16190 [Planctomycetota bacterium]|jgi:hypothetical protein
MARKCWFLCAGVFLVLAFAQAICLPVINGCGSEYVIPLIKWCLCVSPLCATAGVCRPKAHHSARLQIHLSTAVVLMFVVGVLYWTNATPRVRFPESAYYGWPVEFLDAQVLKWLSGTPDVLGACDLNHRALAANSLAALTILLTVYCALEWLATRRRSNCKP